MAGEKVALVTGASKGLGMMLCQRLYQGGSSVLAIARNITPLIDIEKTWSMGCETPGKLLALSVDATDRNAVNCAVETLVEQFGRLDILINNVGGLPKAGQFQDLKAEDWQDCVNLNLMSAVNFCQACYPLLVQSSQARVINMASITALEPGAFNPHYSACKAAIINLSKHLSSLWAQEGILVNSIASGPFDSPSLRGVIKNKAKEQHCDLAVLEEEFIGGLASTIPLGRLGTIEEVAALTMFLVSEQSSWITGTNICIDGGKHRGIL